MSCSIRLIPVRQKCSLRALWLFKPLALYPLISLCQWSLALISRPIQSQFSLPNITKTITISPVSSSRHFAHDIAQPSIQLGWIQASSLALKRFFLACYQHNRQKIKNKTEEVLMILIIVLPPSFISSQWRSNNKPYLSKIYWIQLFALP